MSDARVPHQKVRSALRQVWRWTPARKECLARSKIVGLASTYVCDGCGKATDRVEVDHVVPVGSTPGAKDADGFVTWDGFIKRLFCSTEGLQALCEVCHGAKTRRDA